MFTKYTAREADNQRRLVEPALRVMWTDQPETVPEQARSTFNFDDLFVTLHQSVFRLQIPTDVSLLTKL